MFGIREIQSLCCLLNDSHLLFDFHMVVVSFKSVYGQFLCIIVLSIFFETCRYADEPSIMRYIKIAAMLRDKTVRDVALRCRWMLVSFLHTRMISFGYIMQ